MPTIDLETTVDSDFDPQTWDMVGSLQLSTQLNSGDVLADLADTRSDICVLTADLGRPTKVYSFKLRHPDRYFNFGIAERNMISAAAGLAAVGMKP
jgi:transketolase